MKKFQRTHVATPLLHVALKFHEYNVEVFGAFHDIAQRGVGGTNALCEII